MMIGIREDRGFMIERGTMMIGTTIIMRRANRQRIRGGRVLGIRYGRGVAGRA